MLIILGPLSASLMGTVLAADYRGWRDAAAKAHAGTGRADYFTSYATFRSVGLAVAWTGAVFAVGATVLVCLIYW
ncbi:MULTISPECIES: hypothetical protein [Streptomyces]|uniref:hypothetical protein n=1 Tax=Streptomyces TaxID=1883 RepID=UPI0013B3F5F0|nr:MULTISPECIES: hypothetical protein [Streptomyces]